MDAQTLIKKLNLEKLPEEGGYYRETYRSKSAIPGNYVAPGRERVCGTDIYYLITEQEFSGLHCVRFSDEIFHFYAGDSIEMLQITSEGKLTQVAIGANFEAGESPKVVVPAGLWQGMRLREGGKWALLGCTVMPGFEFEDFVGGTYQELSQRFPEHAALIRRYTHQ